MIEVRCDFCNKIFTKDNNKSKRNFCSRKCKDVWQISGLKGKENPFYNKHHNFITIKNLKEQKIGTHHTEEWKKQHSMDMMGNQHRKGKITSPETKEKQRQAKLGSKSHFYGKPPLHGKRYHYQSRFQGEITFRSSWELKYAQYLDQHNIPWYYEFKTFKLEDITYTPDFYLPETDEYIEIKGYWRGNSKQKFEEIIKSLKDIKIKILFKSDLNIIGVLEC